MAGAGSIYSWGLRLRVRDHSTRRAAGTAGSFDVSGWRFLALGNAAVFVGFDWHRVGIRLKCRSSVASPASTCSTQWACPERRRFFCARDHYTFSANVDAARP
ncbi:Os11g0528001 [Oryza sativa Japonica Group]|uniref:Uncharacterized protein n=2 Tax=Oryza sativa subsp. japonica TaxID=39947 RepID=A0A8J8XG17_ORYSJ|nr:hypothetical protein OsJ_34094 [Oryza sativa Japonica Group]BAT14260.1 Os11g0528001 [Oryza sativa Japonica Group]